MSGSLSFSKLDHIGVIVGDVDKAVRHYQSLGIGPFETVSLSVNIIERSIRGKPIPLDSMTVKEYVGQMGSIKLQLIQPVKGDYYWKEFLETRGEGVQHLGFFVDDIDKETAEMEKKGFEVMYRSRYEGGGGATYFDTGKTGGVLVEFVQWPPKKPARR